MSIERQRDKPLCIELFSGLHGWGEAFVAERYRVVGFDIVDMCAALGHPRSPGIDLVLQDVLTIHGSQFRDAAVIVASPPCQRYSYMAMPWTRAKTMARWYRDPEAASERIADLTALFDACFRIQHEASEAAGRYIPLVIENVKGAQAWVGQAKAHFGSFYLWGDVESVGGRVVAGGVRFGRALSGKRSQKGEGGAWFNDFKSRPDGEKIKRLSYTGSKSPERKTSAAMIAKIPLPLARYIAQSFKSENNEHRASA